MGSNGSLGVKNYHELNRMAFKPRSPGSCFTSLCSASDPDNCEQTSCSLQLPVYLLQMYLALYSGYNPRKLNERQMEAENQACYVFTIKLPFI